MFSDKQIEFMKSIGVSVDFNNLSDNAFVKIEDIVSEKLQKSGFDREDKITEIGIMCESILDMLS
ncbi:MAG: hypothetical protein NC399_04960 [Muribaculum sp.]|nr:hypothetical protein [Muribaculum sp.]